MKPLSCASAFSIALASSYIASAPAAHAQVRYGITDLTEIAAGAGVQNAEAHGISDDGVIVGFEVIEPPATDRGIVWEGGSVWFLDPLPEDTSTQGRALLGADIIVGVSEEVIPNHPKWGLYEDQKATVWLSGVACNLEDMVNYDPWTDPDPRFALDINSNEQVVGLANVMLEPDDFRGFLADGRAFIDLGELTRPMALNDNRVIAGYRAAEPEQAMLWENGLVTNLHVSSGILGSMSRAMDISNEGIIVGQAQLEVDSAIKPVAWIDDEIVDLVPHVPNAEGAATEVSFVGTIIGSYRDLDAPQSDERGFVVIDGVHFDLLATLVGADGWEQVIPLGMNRLGQIVGTGVRDGQASRAFLLEPACVPDMNGDGIVNTLDFVEYLNAYNGADPAADMNLDGVVNTIDFILFLNLFNAGCE